MTAGVVVFEVVVFEVVDVLGEIVRRVESKRPNPKGPTPGAEGAFGQRAQYVTNNGGSSASRPRRWVPRFVLCRA